MQSQNVSWFIALHRLSNSKSLKLDVVKQVVMATATKLGLIKCYQMEEEDFPVDLNDVARRVKVAAGMFFIYSNICRLTPYPPPQNVP